MKRVAELEHEPEVGKYYLVPCIVLKRVVIPVLGSLHEDNAYIGFSSWHYHFDLRFLPDKQIRDRVGYYYRRGPSPVCTPEQFMMSVVTTEHTAGHIAERRMKCRRRMPDFPVTTGVTYKEWMPALEAAFANTRLNCARCPHRGFPLSADNADEQGNVVCAGHGLQFNLATGRLVSRLGDKQ
jgi:hypothetical protein